MEQRTLYRLLHWCGLCALVCASFTFGASASIHTETARAAIRDSDPNQPFASVVDCIETNGSQSPRFATSCFGSAWSIDSYAATGDPNTGDAPGANTAIYSFGDAQPDGSADLVTAGAANGHAAEATLQQVGATYGLAYSAGRNPASPLAGQARLFSGAYTKRLTRFGSGGPGAVYVTRGGTTAPYVTIPSVMPGPAALGGFAANGQPGDGNYANFPNGTSGATFSAGMGGVHTLYNDDTSIAYAGRTGLGDIDLDVQERFLYVVNLWNRLVYRVDTWNTGDPQSTVVPLPVPPQYSDALACNPSGLSGPQDLRPFGLLVTSDSLYLGLTCSAHQSQNAGDLAIGILRFDIASGVWVGWALGAFLNPYDAQRLSGVFNSAWNPWRDSEAGEPFGPVGPAFRTHPQPILADMELTERGDMLIGLRDRYGDMTGSGAMLSFSGTGQGDILLAPRTGPQTWGAPRTDQEDFVDNAQYVGNGDPELAGGALALVPGTHAGGAGEEVIGTFMNPYGAQSAGAAWWNNSAGLPQAREELYTFGTDVNRFGKASGLGDVEILCEYRAIGDRVWRDDNGNGAQDNGEPNIDGVLVNLRDAGGGLQAQVRTGIATGISQNYRFYVQPFTQYTVEIDPSNFAPGGVLAGYGPTLANAVADDADSDVDAQNRIVVPAGPNRDLAMTF
ncbi:MAG TPA: SdrD B-like domain-containing protein, partial [Roseiflexaceae bacterium]|nr:SdrD B-like domain-containing protein [Roseiflexaceae bacterium]